MATKKKLPNVLIGGAMNAAFEGRANKWALYGLLALLLTTISAWGSREYHLRQELNTRTAKLTVASNRLEQAQDKLTVAERMTLTLSEQLKVERSSHSSKRTGRQVRNADGSTIDEWSEEDATAQESMEASKQQVEELTRNLIQAREEVTQVSSLADSLMEEVSSLKVELTKRTHGPFSLALGGTWAVMAPTVPYVGIGYNLEVAGVEIRPEAKVNFPFLMNTDPTYSVGVSLRP